MARRSRVLLAAGIAVVVVVARRSSTEEPGPRRLGEARLLADAGEHRGLIHYTDILRGKVENPTVNQLPLSFASKVVADDAGGFWLVIREHPGGDSALFRSTTDGKLVDAGTVPLGYPVAMTARDGVRAVGARYTFQDHAVLVYDPPDRPHRWRTFLDFADRETFDLPFPRLGALAASGDGTVIASAAGAGTIAVRDAGGAVRRVLGPPNDPAAEQTTGQPLGQITAIVALADGRIAFVADGADDFRLHLLDRGGVRPIDTGDANPVSAEARYDRDGNLVDLAYDQLAPGPDGTLLAIGERRSPQIWLVDPDSGHTESLISLTQIQPTVDRPISAAAVGDDLIFLADGALWILDGAFGAG